MSGTQIEIHVETRFADVERWDKSSVTAMDDQGGGWRMLRYLISDIRAQYQGENFGDGEARVWARVGDLTSPRFEGSASDQFQAVTRDLLKQAWDWSWDMEGALKDAEEV